MTTREFFHLMQIVDDFDDAEERYKALLGMDIFGPKHWSDFDKRWASLGTVGREFVFEIMEPSKDEADFGSPLPKFRNRHGQTAVAFCDAGQPMLTLLRRPVGAQVQGRVQVMPHPGHDHALVAAGFRHGRGTSRQGRIAAPPSAIFLRDDDAHQVACCHFLPQVGGKVFLLMQVGPGGNTGFGKKRDFSNQTVGGHGGHSGAFCKATEEYLRTLWRCGPDAE